MGFSEGIDIAGQLGKMKIIDLEVDPGNRYTLFSGLTGGLFLFMSYFGTDQSQVQRYLGGKSLKASRIGLMFNGLMKIPMQFFILLVGAMLFVAFQFNEPPIIFNADNTQIELDQIEELAEIEKHYKVNFSAKKNMLMTWSTDKSESFDAIQNLQFHQDSLRAEYKTALSNIDPGYQSKDHDYIFLTFVLNFLPHGLIGLLLAVIFSAAMSSTAGELNALASTTTIDFYKKYWSVNDNEKRDLLVSKWLTVGWGVLAIVIALVAGLFENLIQLVNILGSLFYGTILGVFLLAFFFKHVKAKAALWAGVVAQVSVLILHYLTVQEYIELSYLLYNIIGSGIVILTGLLIQTVLNTQNKTENI